MYIILIPLLFFMLSAPTLELRAGNWNYQGRDIPVFSKGKEYKAYIFKEGVFTLRKNADDTFSPIKFDNFEDRYHSYEAAEDWQFDEMKRSMK